MIKISANFNCNFIETLSKFLKKMRKFCTKLDKISIKDWGIAQKIQRKLEKSISFE